MRSTAPAHSAPIHRALLRFPIDRRGAFAGIVVGLVIITSIIAFSQQIWRAEEKGLSALLRLSDTPHKIAPRPNLSPGIFGGTVDGGATFTVPSTPSPISPAGAGAGAAVFVILSIVAVRWERIPVPAKVLWLLFAALGVSTLWYTGFVSGTPPQPVNELTIGFQRGGLLAIMVATVLFAFEVFPVPGSVRLKVSWLGVLIVFSFAWSVVRMAFTLATVHHVGSWTFVYLQYIAGPVVDFLSVVAAYSLVTHGLARRIQERLV